jgi:hypothetical protein
MGLLEKTHQRCSPHFPVLTYWKYAPRLKMAVALLDGFFEPTRGSWHSTRLLGF